ncbi:hypothetical protein ACGFNU_17520 [Spirillospora sp. NPDC048911]|uniref:hypothetical protein n=1 Tax=Spirillospora sp. NPDC048911 TaxID=3364527 RepID=UPI003717DD33
MRIVVQMKLLPTPEQAAALAATLRACNAAADHVSVVAFDREVFSRNDLQKITYGEVKAVFGLSAQPTARVVKKVVDAYTTLRASIRAGRLGPPGSPRRLKAEGKPIRFRLDAAQPFDDRCLSWQTDAHTVSIWTMAGRLKGIAFTGSPAQLETLTDYRQGESDLAHRDGMWFLYATCDVPTAPLNTDPVGWVGFACRRCGLAGPADVVAAVNVARRARTAWAFVNTPAPQRT